MTEQLLSILPVLTQILTVILLAVLIIAGWYLIRFCKDLAEIAKRLEILTDIGGWLGLWKKFSKK